MDERVGVQAPVGHQFHLGELANVGDAKGSIDERMADIDPDLTASCPMNVSRSFRT